MDDYLTPKFRDRCGIEMYLVYFQQLKSVILGVLEDPALRKNQKWMSYVFCVSKELHLARKGVNFKALNGV